jgi:hypothetical protein
MKPEEDSPFFYKCHLKASRSKPEGESESASEKRSGQSSYSGEGEPEVGGRLDGAGYSERGVSGGFEGD